MQRLSIVIICKNNADVLGSSIESFYGLTDDIVVYDNGSKDHTGEILKKLNVNLIEGVWEGYGQTKNKANEFAKHDWILSLDADEGIDDELKKNLLELDLSDPQIVYVLKFKNYLGSKWLKYGEWGNDKHIRLFNRKLIRWNEAAVHERLEIPVGTKTQTLNGFVIHRTAIHAEAFENKMRTYAKLNAENYFRQGKRTGSLKMYLSAGFSFLKNYIFKFGFLDGKAGYDCARINALYTYLKYKNLKKLTESKDMQH